MALKPPAAKKPSEAEINRVIAGGNAARGDTAPIAGEPAKEIAFTMTIPPKLAALIDASREPTKTSRRAWLLQAAEDRLKRDGLIG